MKMSDKEIKVMLQKYMDGMTSVEEEAKLTKYFSKAGNKAAPEGMDDADWQAYKEMFAMFAPKQQHKAAVVGLWRWAAAVAAGALLVVAGSQVVLHRPTSPAVPSGQYVATIDSTARETVRDTMELGGTPQEKMPAVKKRKRHPVRQRHEPVVPRHYMAQSAPAEIDPEEALRQADLLMQAVYLQQQSDLNSAMMQCTLIIEEEDEAY